MKYIATIETWPQVGPESVMKQFITKVVDESEPVSKIMEWAKARAGDTVNVTITPNTQ